jgi:SAM-dependent methyltransferase
MELVFKKIKSVNNPNSVHGIYPYRGKISAIDAEQFVKQLPSGSLILDPFCGTGTILYEAQKYGLKTLGVDMNPIAIDIAKAKLSDVSYDDIFIEAKEIVSLARELKRPSKMPGDSLKHFHKDTAEEIMRVSYFIDKMSDYTKACFYGAIALSARGCNQYKWTSSTVGKDIEPKIKIDFYQKFLQKIKKHYQPIKNRDNKVYLSDSRKLSEIIPAKSVDFVFTSPPYFDCLDYTAYYAKIIFNILGVDRLEVKKNLIQNYGNYSEDMKKVLEELKRVCKVGAKIIFVVGDKKIHGNTINGADFFSKISPFKEVKVIEREYKGSSSQVFDTLNKTQRKEQIIIWTN